MKSLNYHSKCNMAISALSLIGLMTMLVPAYAHNAHERLHRTDQQVSYTQDAVESPAVPIPKEINHDKSLSRPFLSDTMGLISGPRICGAFDEFHESEEPGNEHIPDNCCGHCTDVIGQDTFRTNTEAGHTYEFLPWYPAFNLPDNTSFTGKKYYSEYRDRSPPSLLQSILKYRILLI